MKTKCVYLHSEITTNNSKRRRRSKKRRRERERGRKMTNKFKIIESFWFSFRSVCSFVLSRVFAFHQNIKSFRWPLPLLPFLLLQSLWQYFFSLFLTQYAHSLSLSFFSFFFIFCFFVPFSKTIFLLVSINFHFFFSLVRLPDFSFL